MRRSTALPSIVVALALFSVGVLHGQEWVLGPYIDLPEHDYNLTLNSVSLPDGNVVIAAEARTNPFPDTEVELQLFTVNPEDGTVGATWSRPFLVDRPVEMTVSGDGLLLFDNPGVFPSSPENQLRGVLQDPTQGGDLGAPFRIDSLETSASQTFDITRLEDGQLVAVWTGPGVPGGTFSRIFLQRFDDQGTLLGPAEIVASVVVGQLRVVGTPDGGFVVAWRQPNTGTQILGRRFDSEGVAQGPIQEFVGVDNRVLSFDLEVFPDGTLLAVWTDFDGAISQLLGRRIDAQGQPFPEIFHVAPLSETQKSDNHTTRDAFGRVWVTWIESGQVWIRQVRADGSLSSLLPIPAREPNSLIQNPNITVDKNGHGLVVWTEVILPGPIRTLQARTVEIDNSCMESDTMLCLHQGRFRVEVDWTDHAGDIGQGRVVPFQSSDSGLFWFFDEANWEVMVKVIDGCNFNGFYWIFSAATTDVAYDLKVTDTVTGLDQIYSNPLGEPAPANTDTMALMSCGHGPP